MPVSPEIMPGGQTPPAPPAPAVRQQSEVMPLAMSVDRVVDQLQRIQEIMRRVMKDKTHYGVVSGCKKPSLWKPGAELLLTTFRLTAGDPIIEDLSGPDVIRYRIRTPIVNPHTGYVHAVGIGESSSDASKYKWREAVCQDEWDEFPADRRRKHYKKDYGKVKVVFQVRQEPADQANTVLKMAHKSSIIAGTLLALAASDIFAQDLEDLAPPPSDDGQQAKTPKKTAPPTRKSTPSTGDPAAATEKQVKFLIVRLKGSGIAGPKAQAYLRTIGLPSGKVTEKNDAGEPVLRKSQVNDILAWIEKEKKPEPAADESGE